ncbi:hypothetical protein GCM10011608_10930 [Micromonospora sonchi]|uniref:Uncharacterized protein n=1 Tax=Micromonospora sonchi TaxID=1763543 RepID=A0A917WTI5_9ACTN|nr:hypothetical protein [Micromonospora sonchi]GGM27918.1 hypothetical protein GCM10011608_10930 [Micromonospora sonchi]
MATASDADEFSYLVPGWYWDKQRDTAIRNARAAARRKRKQARGEPQVHVVLVWPQDDAGTVAAAG